MSTLLRAELLKLRTTRTFLALVASAAALSLLVAGLTAGLTDRFDPDSTRELFTADASGLFILLLGIMGMAGEWRHRTITTTVLAAPDRLRLLAAKVIAYAVAGVVLSLAVTLAVFVVGSIILSARDVDLLSGADFADVLWRNLLVAALTGAFGVCIGAVVRNQVVAIVGVLVIAFALEPALIAVSPDVGRFGPTNGAPTGIVDTDPFGDEVELLAPGAAVLVMVAWIGAGFAAGAALLRRRDLV